jgi:hypothetical protein
MSLIYDEIEQLQQSIENEMPYFSNRFIKIKYTYGPFPKNLMNEAIKVNEKFLNKFQAKIEQYMGDEYLYKFRAYQNKYFSNQDFSQNFKESIFNNCKCKTQQQINDITLQTTINNMSNQIGMNHIINNITGIMNNTKFGMLIDSFRFATSCAGDDLSTTSVAQNVSTTTGYIRASSPATGSTDDCYDQLGISCGTAVGNYRLGSYDNTSNNPVNLEAETPSHSAQTGINMQSVTEYTLATAKQWVGLQSDNNGNQHGIYTDSSGLRLEGQSYGAFPSTFSPTTDNSPNYSTLRHS